MRYSPTTRCFYPESISYRPESLPDDLVTVECTDYMRVMSRGSDEGFSFENGVFTIIPAPLPDLNDYKIRLCKKVDTAAEQARMAAVGYVTRSFEYDVVAADAATFKAGGYIGDLPASIQTWADIKGYTPQQATDDILATRDAYLAALLQVRDIRLKAKAAIMAAITMADADSLAETAIGQLNAIAEYASSL